MPELPDPAIEALWKNALDHWDEDKSHTAFLEACRERGKLAEAGARYRGMAGDRDRGPEAEKRLKAILAIAIASLEVTRTPEPVVKRRATALVILVVLVAATIGLMVYVTVVR
ncbi:MAG: hypothetical protein IPI67_01640 [Myxococcales bacterium]|nr:hypothetical protein [Myxococcales bacterium]